MQLGSSSPDVLQKDDKPLTHAIPILVGGTNRLTTSIEWLSKNMTWIIQAEQIRQISSLVLHFSLSFQELMDKMKEASEPKKKKITKLEFHWLYAQSEWIVCLCNVSTLQLREAWPDLSNIHRKASDHYIASGLSVNQSFLISIHAAAESIVNFTCKKYSG